jgi:hypothetical protein
LKKLGHCQRCDPAGVRRVGILGNVSDFRVQPAHDKLGIGKLEGKNAALSP